MESAPREFRLERFASAPFLAVSRAASNSFPWGFSNAA
jgi:hypothetical protein